MTLTPERLSAIKNTTYVQNPDGWIDPQAFKDLEELVHAVDAKDAEIGELKQALIAARLIMDEEVKNAQAVEGIDRILALRPSPKQHD